MAGRPPRENVAGSSPPSSRNRILAAAKALFASKGYEYATTLAIARSASTSETQVLKHFGNKQGILDAIFTEGWDRILHDTAKAMALVSAPKEKLAVVVNTVMVVMDRDPELKLILLLEGRRMRKGGPILALSESFLSFVSMLDGILNEMRDSGMLQADLHPQAIRSALMGMLEGLLRDNLLAHKADYPAKYSMAEVLTLLRQVLRCFIPPST